MVITHYPGWMWVSGTVLPDSIWCFFPQLQMVFSHTCFDQYSTKYLSVTFCRFCSPLSAPLFSLVLCPPISSCLGPPILSALSLQLRKITSLCLGSASCTTAWWVGGNHRFHLISFPLSGIIILYCLISSDLNSVISYILSGFSDCFRQEYKSGLSCSIPVRSGNLFVPF